MKKIVLLFLFLISAQFYTANAQTNFELEGVVVPRTIEFKSKELQLIGFGTRSKFWLDIYVQALYLSVLSQDPKYILESDTKMAVRIQIISSMVTSKKLSKALNKGLIKSVGEDKIEAIRSQVDMLEKLIGSEITKEGDAFNLIYNPEDLSIWVYKNDKLEGKIPGFEFKKAFFGIWLSDNPVDEDLKKDLLGLGK
ncbi:chalcone isomerase family protein [Flavobacterium sp.]|uniref:chalcone isomerase family protein n=1 Tax=Flavobacterium sp. TaxID=239 RepID=UPI00286D7945|nr:chalcone isomerase family protein [Flavobacterium sp.]